MTKNIKDIAGKRHVFVKVKTAKDRKLSSTRWLQRQLNDPYVQAAQQMGFKSRAAFKLIEIDDKYHLLKTARGIVDLGCAPGGWLQVAQSRTSPTTEILGIDLLDIDVPNVLFIKGDFTADDAPEKLQNMMSKPVDVVMSDMAPYMTGNQTTDRIRMEVLIELAIDFALHTLENKGHFICKVFSGGAPSHLVSLLKKHFEKVSHFKPQSSRKESEEIYLVAKSFKKKTFQSNT